MTGAVAPGWVPSTVGPPYEMGAAAVSVGVTTVPPVPLVTSTGMTNWLAAAPCCTGRLVSTVKIQPFVAVRVRLPSQPPARTEEASTTKSAGTPADPADGSVMVMTLDGVPVPGSAIVTVARVAAVRSIR